jgi:hypothetical protein
MVGTTKIGALLYNIVFIKSSYHLNTPAIYIHTNTPTQSLCIPIQNPAISGSFIYQIIINSVDDFPEEAKIFLIHKYTYTYIHTKQLHYEFRLRSIKCGGKERTNERKKKSISLPLTQNVTKSNAK